MGNYREREGKRRKNIKHDEKSLGVSCTFLIFQREMEINKFRQK